jgi:zinc protease
MRRLPLCALLVVLTPGPLPSGPPLAGTPKLQRFRLDNGLKVVLRRVPGAKDAALVVLYALGEDHDPRGKSGLGHMLEHLYVTAAAGASKGRTVEDIVARYPRGWNAQTTDGYTWIAWVFARKELDRELKDAAARMCDLRMAESDLKRERQRVLDEVGNMFGGIPSLAAQNHARQLARPGPPGARRGGAPAGVQKLTLEDLQARWSAFYKPRNAILILVGDFDLAETRKAVTDLFGKIPAGKPAPPAQPSAPPKLGSTEEVQVRPRVPAHRVEVCLAYPAPAPGSDLYAPFLVLLARLQGRTGELKPGPGQFPVRYFLLEDPAVVYVAAPVRKEEMPRDTVARLEAFVARGIAEKFTAADVTRALARFGPSLGFGAFADLAARSNPYGEAFGLAWREHHSLDSSKLERALKAVRAEDVGRAAREVFGRRAAVIVIPHKE